MEKLISVLTHEIIIASFIFIIVFLVVIRFLFGGIKTKWFEIGTRKKGDSCKGTECRFFMVAQSYKTVEQQYRKMDEYFIMLGRYFYEANYKQLFKKKYPSKEITEEKEYRQYTAMAVLFKHEWYSAIVKTALKENGFVKIYREDYIREYIKKKSEFLFERAGTWWDKNYSEYRLNDEIDRQEIIEYEKENKNMFLFLTACFLVECIIISLREDVIRAYRTDHDSFPDEENIDELFTSRWGMKPKDFYDKFTEGYQ